MYAAFKPPIKGLTMQKLHELSPNEYTKEQLTLVYEPIARHTLAGYWLFMDRRCIFCTGA